MVSDSDEPLIKTRPKKNREPVSFSSDSDSYEIVKPKKRNVKGSQTKVVRAKAKAKAKSSAKNKKSTQKGSTKPIRKPKAKAKSKARSKGSKETSKEALHVTNTLWNKMGQKNFCPPQGDGHRVYYESAYEQEPNCYIAIKYMIENGCFETGSIQLQEAYEKYLTIKEMGAYRKLGGLRPELTPVLEKISKKYNLVISKNEMKQETKGDKTTKTIKNKM